VRRRSEPGDQAAGETGDPPGRDPAPLTGREVAALMLIWTMALGGWYALAVVNGADGPGALVLAAGGLFAVIWLLGLLMLGLFLGGGE